MATAKQLANSLAKKKAKVAKLQKEVKAETAAISKLTTDLAAAKKKEAAAKAAKAKAKVKVKPKAKAKK
jgi:cell division protein FtsB